MIRRDEVGLRFVFCPLHALIVNQQWNLSRCLADGKGVINGGMKKRLIPMVCAVAMTMLCASSARAYTTANTAEVAADALIVRPISFVGTVLGSIAFVVTLPFTAPCHGVDTAANALVVAPAQFTFTRPLGEVDTWDVDAF